MKVGTPADAVLKTRGYRERGSVRLPQMLPPDENGLVVCWFYADEVLTIARPKKSGPYCVTEVKRRNWLGRWFWGLFAR